jgi:predicted amidohydrolase
MRVGFVQFAPRLGAVDRNLSTIERLARRADLLVFPELATSGYVFRSKAEAEAAAVYALPRLQALADRIVTGLVVGFPERVGRILFNSAALVTPGARPQIYRKNHLFLNEKDFFKPGDRGLPVFRFRGARIGVLICFDWAFPEACRTLALRGADIVCVPSNLVLKGYAVRGVVVHAMVNRVFMVLCNRTGLERGVGFYGQSMIVAPGGKILTKADPRNESVKIVTIDPRKARDKRITPRNDLFKDRRPEIYSL